MAAKDISLVTIKAIVRVDGTDFDQELKDKLNAAVGFIIGAGIEATKFTFDTDVYDKIETGYEYVDIQIVDLVQSYVKTMFGYSSENIERPIPDSWFLRLKQVVLTFKGRESLA